MNITLLSRKGGVGKSTTAIHLASVLADQGRHVLVVDGDANLSALQWHRRAPEPLPFNVVDANAEAQAVAKAYREGKPYDATIVDTSAAPDERKLAALLDREDAVVVLPTTVDALAIGGLFDTVADLEHRRGQGAVLPPYFAVVTRVRHQATRDVDQAVDVLEGQGVPVLAARVREAQAFQRAALAGLTARQQADRYGEVATNAYGDYERVVAELRERTQAVTA